jgi:ornithine cyclodeaminase/alanine dehydrogenase-like protein (mu-crystallin family)
LLISHHPSGNTAHDYRVSENQMFKSDRLLGRLIQDPSLGRRGERDISIADLTGVAVQDMAIAELALQVMQGE